MNEVSSLHPRRLRRAFGQFATGVAVATARDAAGRATAVTISSFGSVSLDPPLVSFALARSAHCLQAFLDCPTPAISILSHDHQWIAGNFARPSTCQWEGVSLHESAEGHLTLKGALATFECGREAAWVAGDHLLFLLAVHRADIHDGSPDPLLFFRGRFETLSSDCASTPEREFRWSELGIGVQGWG